MIKSKFMKKVVATTLAVVTAVTFMPTQAFAAKGYGADTEVNDVVEEWSKVDDYSGVIIFYEDQNMKTAKTCAYAGSDNWKGKNAKYIAGHVGTSTNLGNYLDATKIKAVGNQYSGDALMKGAKEWNNWDPNYQAANCNIDIPQSYFTALKANGFDTIRIPVSYHNHVTVKKNKYGDHDKYYVVDQKWLATVKKYVDRALKAGLHVILNMHHDLDGSDAPFNIDSKQGKRFFIDVWIQVATYFRNYDENLVFENLNEPRTSNVNYGTNEFGDAGEAAAVAKWNAAKIEHAYAEAFVDIVRYHWKSYKTNNTKRALLVSTYNNDTSYVSIAGLYGGQYNGKTKYGNPATDAKYMINFSSVSLADLDNKLIVSLHAYRDHSGGNNLSGDYNVVTDISGWDKVKDHAYNPKTNVRPDWQNVPTMARLSSVIPVVFTEYGSALYADSANVRNMLQSDTSFMMWDNGYNTVRYGNVNASNVLQDEARNYLNNCK